MLWKSLFKRFTGSLELTAKRSKHHSNLQHFLVSNVSTTGRVYIYLVILFTRKWKVESTSNKINKWYCWNRIWFIIARGDINTPLGVCKSNLALIVSNKHYTPDSMWLNWRCKRNSKQFNGFIHGSVIFSFELWQAACILIVLSPFKIFSPLFPVFTPLSYTARLQQSIYQRATV